MIYLFSVVYLQTTTQLNGFLQKDKKMKKLLLLLLLLGFSNIYGQHVKLQHATIRMWTSQSNPNQRGAEYRITLKTLKKIKGLSFSKILIGDRCFSIDAVMINNNETISAQNITIAKDNTIKILLNVKEILNDNGEWVLNNETCTKSTGADYQGKATIEYLVKNSSCTFSFADFEMLPTIQYE